MDERTSAEIEERAAAEADVRARHWHPCASVAPCRVCDGEAFSDDGLSPPGLACHLWCAVGEAAAHRRAGGAGAH